MMKKLIVLAFLLGAGMLFAPVYGQITDSEKELRKVKNDTTKGWERGGLVNLNMSQTSLTNWSAGGENSIAVNSFISLYARYFTPKLNWDNNLDISYGIVKKNKEDGWIKNDDKIDLVSKFGYRASKKWYYAGLVNFKTQSTPGYNYPNDSVKISEFLAPAYVLTAAGMDFKPNPNFNMFIAVLTAKTTIVNNRLLAAQGSFGVEPGIVDTLGNIIKKGQNIRNEFGGYIRLSYKKDFTDNISMQTKLDLFSNYLENPQNIDINWETLIALKITKYFSATINTHLIYDDDINIDVMDKDGNVIGRGPRTQFKEVIGFGILYKFK